ncbi:efflux RND transporter periplasmic adaptor subunit [Estrella lausannensis]|uniref:Efflux transporter, RND family, MFP subunit n=1 Tax=Estrella lausannensis TaxID=483423 RepID=A0A0H5DT85_9BACT|nr:efflux RND transporter periplasmic adaptor subunit [Estrella lausannensis]CRX39568.1 Efflux transporter, RND family, MFP subunit [Estrella lausannensis]
MMTAKSLFVSILLLPLTLALLTSGCKKQEAAQQARPAMAILAQEEEIIKPLLFPGKTRASRRVNLSFRVDGLMHERTAQVGDSVKKGDTIARLDTEDFETALENILGKKERAEAALRFAENDYSRSERLYQQDRGAISEVLLDQKKETVNELRGQIKSLMAEERAAKNNLDYASLKAPFDGTIVAVYVQNFEYIKAKQPIMRLLGSDAIEMVIDVPEKMIGKIFEISSLKVEFDAYPGKWHPAKISEIGTEASSTTSTFPVTLLIYQPEGYPLLSGMTGTAIWNDEGKDKERKIILPAQALFSENGKEEFVFKFKEDTKEAIKAPVKKGSMTSRGIVIEEGVKPGEWIITSGVHTLREGQKITIKQVRLNDSGEIEEYNAPLALPETRQ